MDWLRIIWVGKEKIMKINKIFLIFLVILIQSSLAISAGFFSLYLVNEDRIPPNVYVEGVKIGGMRNGEAIRKLEDIYKNLLKNGSVSIIYNDANEFKIPYSEIDVYIDWAATVDSLYNSKGGRSLVDLAVRYFYQAKRNIVPVVRLNEQKLREKLKELALIIYKEPVNADIYIENGIILKIKEIDGLNLNINNACSKILDEFKKHTAVAVEFNEAGNYEIETMKAPITLEELEEIDEVIAEYSTEIVQPVDINSVKSACSAIDKVLVRAADKAKNLLAEEFSFNECLNRKNLLQNKNKNNEGFNQVASTLYVAILLTGIDHKSIFCIQNKTLPEYIEPGMDVYVSEDGVDFKFTNTLSHDLLIFPELSDNRLTVRIAGKSEDRSLKREIKTDILQRFSPPVINIENKELSPGQKILVEPGREGIMVKTYRITLKNGEKIKEEVINTHTYQAVKSIVQVGPGFEWQDGGYSSK